jgi:hypothetical protein
MHQNQTEWRKASGSSQSQSKRRKQLENELNNWIFKKESL